MGQQWPAAGSGALETTVLAYVLLEGDAIAPTVFWPQAKLQEGT